jgi:hypothetical protein
MKLGNIDFLGKARRLESKIARRFDSAARDFIASGAREPLEIVHSIVEAVDPEIQAGGRGRRVFPFNSITLSVLAPSRDARARFEAVVAGEPPLRQRIVDRLRSAGCEVAELVVEVVYVTRAQKSWKHPGFHIDFARVTPVGAADVRPDPKHTRLELTISRGVAERRTYAFMARRIDLGRCAEVRDSRNRLIRTNHVAFAEGSGDVNQSVSRQHAHIGYASGDYRLYDDRSAHGTSILRNGKTVAVPTGSRGVRLRSGDEIVLGEARVRIRFEEEGSR